MSYTLPPVSLLTPTDAAPRHHLNADDIDEGQAVMRALTAAGVDAESVTQQFAPQLDRYIVTLAAGVEAQRDQL